MENFEHIFIFFNPPDQISFHIEQHPNTTSQQNDHTLASLKSLEPNTEKEIISVKDRNSELSFFMNLHQYI